MDKLKFRAIVLKETPVGENDKFLTLLAKGVGKITVKAKGARNAKNKTACGTSLFSYCDYIVIRTKTTLIMTQADVIKSFFDVTADLDKFFYGAAAVEIAEKVLQEGQSNDDVMLLLLKTLQKISSSDSIPRMLFVIYCIKFMQYYGCMPDVCCECTNQPTYFDAFGFYCENCRPPKSMLVSKNAVKFTEYVLNSDINGIFSVRCDMDTLVEAERIARVFFIFNIDVKIYSWEQADKL